MKSVWAFDIDGVVADTYPVLQSMIEREYKLCFFQMPYYVNKEYSNIDKNSFYTLLNGLFIKESLKPIEGAIEFINDYYKKYKRIVFITHRNPSLILHTYNWLNKYFDFNYELYQGYRDKVIIAKEKNIIGIIDDKPSTCKHFIQNKLKTICYRQPHQVYENVKELDVCDWNEIRNLLF